MLLNIYQTFTSDYQQIVKESTNPHSVSARFTLQLQASLLLLRAFCHVLLLLMILQVFHKNAALKNVVDPRSCLVMMHSCPRHSETMCFFIQRLFSMADPVSETPIEFHSV